MSVATLAIASLWDGAPCREDERATVTVERVPDGSLLIHIDAPMHGDPPPAGEPGSTDKLWEHEVVELFVLGDGERYTEIEVGPHGHFLVLRFEGPRANGTSGHPLEVSMSRGAERWTATARLDAGLVPAGELRGNAYAIHGIGEGRRYLAWTPVPGPHPDFHRIAMFAPLGL